MFRRSLFLGYVDADRHFQVHSTDCTKYVEVVPGVGGAVTFVKSCSFGLFWDEISLTCVNSTQANCFNGTNNIRLCLIYLGYFFS